MRTRPPRSEPDSSVPGQTRKDAGCHDCTPEHDIAAYQPYHRQPGQPGREPARQPEGEEDGHHRERDEHNDDDHRNKAAHGEQFKAALANLGQELAYMDQPEFAAFWEADTKRIEAAIRSIGKVEG